MIDFNLWGFDDNLKKFEGAGLFTFKEFMHEKWESDFSIPSMACIPYYNELLRRVKSGELISVVLPKGTENYAGIKIENEEMIFYVPDEEDKLILKESMKK